MHALIEPNLSASVAVINNIITCAWDGAGETRQVIIPGHEGYGAKGFPAWGIPPNGTLDFTLEVLKIE